MLSAKSFLFFKIDGQKMGKGCPNVRLSLRLISQRKAEFLTSSVYYIIYDFGALDGGVDHMRVSQQYFYNRIESLFQKDKFLVNISEKLHWLH